VHLLWTPHNLASLGTLRAQIPKIPTLHFFCGPSDLVGSSHRHHVQPEPRTLNVKRFRGGLVFKAHGLLHHSTLGLRAIKKKRRYTLNVRAGITSPHGSIKWSVFRPQIYQPSWFDQMVRVQTSDLPCQRFEYASLQLNRETTRNSGSLSLRVSYRRKRVS